MTVPTILVSISNVRVVLLALLANFVVVAAIAFGRVPHLVGRAGPPDGAPHRCRGRRRAVLAQACPDSSWELAARVGLMVVLMVVTIVYLPLVMPLLAAGDVESTRGR